ncbi:hypothetical protein [uncultured Nostoc sp.]|uniref:hypothetical protein n=1 Tax=uncultured Nostoc sp. TaxID=340711 RepID=UPI0035CA92D2
MIALLIYKACKVPGATNSSQVQHKLLTAVVYLPEIALRLGLLKKRSPTQEILKVYLYFI